LARPQITSGGNYQADFEFVRKDGTPIWCSVYGKAIDIHQLWLGTVWVMQDITARKQAKQKILEHSEALQASLDQLAETQMQLVQQEKMASLGTLTAGIAHEINNPAHFAHLGVFNLRNKVQSFQEFLLSLAGPDAPRHLVDRINQHVQELNQDLDVVSEGTIRIRDLVRDLRTFSRLDEADWKSVHIADSLLSTVNLVRTQYLEIAHIKLDLKANPLLECWPAQLNQVFMNLIINACQAIQSKQIQTGDNTPGLLTIRSHLEGDWMVFEFEDNGCGMSQQTIDQIYDPFFTTKTVGEGMGMGLSISFGIIKKHRGTILVRSELGEGTCFTLHLPLLPSRRPGH
jgi:signal transduction histidine kinase